MDKIPTLQEWRIANPGKSLNDYYAEFGHRVSVSPPLIQSATPPSYQAYHQLPPQVVYVERGNSVDMFGIVASGVALVAYVLPWIKFQAVMGRFQFGSVSPGSCHGSYL